MGKRFYLTRVVAAFLAAMLLASPGYGSHRETIPPDPYAPIYMDWYADDERVAFVFYRPPGCVPDNFDLFVFFDMPGAFYCTPLTVEGFVIYNDNFVPREAKLTGLGDVPVWFISRDDYDAAVADGDLRFSEISQSDSLLQGFATFYKRHIRGEHPVSKVNIVASGVLDDGSKFDSFWFHAFWGNNGTVNVNIELE